MHHLINPLVAALQLELQEYGALLHIFERQQACIIRHDPEGFLDMNPEVEQQIELLARCRHEREELARTAARAWGQPEDAALTKLVPLCPPARRPLLLALIDEINSLAARTQRRMRQNCELLAGCVEAAREVVAAVHGDETPEMYSAHGRLPVRYQSVPRTSAAA